jgi:hypothetical protein
MQFWRIFNNQIIPQYETNLVGWSKNGEYPTLKDANKFLVYRTALGVGDWVMLERLPKALKSYYPECEVYLPSPKLLKETFGAMLDQWSSWGDVSKTVELVFKNNPYIDGYVDSWGEIYSDHYRIYDENNWKTPLVRQMARFFGIPDEFVIDEIPQLYFDESEIYQSLLIFNKLESDAPFGFNVLHISNRNKPKDNQILYNYIIANRFDNLPFIYHGNKKNTVFENLEIIGNTNDINNPRIQFYIKSQAQNIIGNQTGATDVVCGLTKVHSLHHSPKLEETFRVGNYLPSIAYIDKDEYNNSSR